MAELSRQVLLRWRYGLYFPLLILGGSVFFQVLQVISQRVAYPFELEWMEGSVLQQVLRVVHHQSLYGKPSLDFVPALYMPLYYYISSVSVLLLGESLFALRVVSVIAFFTALLLCFVIARKITTSILAGLLASVLAASMFSFTGFWFDLARVDTLWTMLLLSSWWSLLLWHDQPQSSLRMFFFALASVLAFFTKQASLFVFPFIVGTVICWMGWRALWRYCAACALLGVPVLGWLSLTTGGHFLFYTLQMASTHGVTEFGWQRFAEIVLWSTPFFILTVPVFLGLVGGNWRNRMGWLLLILGFVFVSGLSRAYAGAFYNALMPMYTCLALVAAATMGLLLEKLLLLKPKIAIVGTIFLNILLAINILHSRFDVDRQIPAPRDTAATQFLLDKLKSVQGPVCVTSHGYLGRMAGRSFCAHNTQVTDLVTGSDPVLAKIFLREAQEKIRAGYYAVIVLDREKELHDLGLNFADIPYTVTKLDYPNGPIRFPVNGYSPTFWLERK